MVSSGLLYLLYYTFIGPIMPQSLYDQLQIQIGKILDGLQGSTDLPPFLDVPQLYRPDIIRVLKQWQSEAPTEYPTSRVRQEVIKGRRRDVLQKQIHFGMPDEEIAKGCEKQSAFYLKTGILMLGRSNDKYIENESPALFQSYQSFKKNQAVDSTTLASVDASWKSNVTMIDMDWQRNKEDDVVDLDVANSPFEWAMKLEQIGMTPMTVRHSGVKSSNGLYAHVEFWLGSVVQSLKDIKSRIKIEACIGDVASVLEQVRYGVVGHRPARDGTSDPSSTSSRAQATAKGASTAESTKVEQAAANYQYPQLYDRIHLSNIPDYIGGTLVTFLYALPVLHPGDDSYVTACCLRNPPRFRSMAHFNNEYIALSLPSDLKKTFHVRTSTVPHPDNPFPLVDYMRWHYCEHTGSFSDLMPRHALETWLYRLFFKIVVPKERTTRDNTLIYAPINLTVFVRLCAHLHGVGYPAHWISGVLSKILSGSVLTTARPPRSQPLKIREVKNETSVMKQSTAPFVAELSTLLGIWQAVLPFPVSVSSLPGVSGIREYSFTLGTMPEKPVAEPPAFILLFRNVYVAPPGPFNLRPYLLSDETSDSSSKAKEMREKGLRVVTTWTWSRARKTASFWLRQDLMEEMMEDNGWMVSIWRSDDWLPQSEGRLMSMLNSPGPTWQ